MSDIVKRPQAFGKKIHSKNEFELCYIRHQYFRKVNFNPTNEEMSPYYRIVEHMAKNTFFTYQSLLRLVGFELEDVVNIGKVHLVNFLGLFSLSKLPEKKREFIALFNKINQEDPSAQDFINKDKANLTMFLKQRMEDLIRISRQKARNIKGLPTEEYMVFYGTKKPPKIVKQLLHNYEDFGYKKMDISVYKSIKKKAKVRDSLPFKFDKNWYISVPLEQKMLTLSDFAGAGLDPYDSLHNMDPERILLSKQETVTWEDKKEEFYSLNDKRKSRMIKMFIKKYRSDPTYKEELKTARKLLKDLEE